MKRRLGILGIVLAAGVWLWFNYQSPPNESVLQSPVSTEETHGNRQRPPVWQANWSSSMAANATPTHQQAQQWLAETIAQLHKLPPFWAKIRMDIHLFGDTLQVNGRYVQSRVEAAPGQFNQATRDLYRWDFEFSGEPEPIRTSQMFDGRFFYSLHTNTAERLLEYVDLDKVRNIVDRQEGNLAPPSAWSGTGGLAKILEHLQSSFQFYQSEPITPSNPNGMPFQVLRGQWKIESLRQLLRGQVAPEHLEPEIMWDRLPKQLPHAVEIWIGNDEHVSRFPYRLMFYQYVESQKNQWQPQLMFATTLYELEFPGPISVENFQVDTTGVQPIELTKDYYDRIRMFLSYPIE